MGHAIGRLGCFAAGCCYGKPTDHFWGVTFTNPLAQELVGTPLGHALEPTQLFESAAELGIFFILTWMFRRKKFDGQIFGAYLFLYGIARFFIEFLRDDPGRGKLRAIDVEPVASTPKEFSATMAKDTRQWRELADRLGIKPE